MSEGSITAEMRAVIGREAGPFVVDVSPTVCRMFARAVGYEDRVYYDEDVAKAAGYRTIPAPAGYLGTWRHDPTNPETRTMAPDVPFPPTMKGGLNGGTEIKYHDQVYAGDVLRATGKITAIVERPGRDGKTMVFVTREVEYWNQDGVHVATLVNSTIRF